MMMGTYDRSSQDVKALPGHLEVSTSCTISQNAWIANAALHKTVHRAVGTVYGVEAGPEAASRTEAAIDAIEAAAALGISCSRMHNVRHETLTRSSQASIT